MQGKMGGHYILQAMLFLLVLVDEWVFFSMKEKKGGGRMDEDVVKK